MHDFTDFRLPNFTKFEHYVDRWSGESFQNLFLVKVHFSKKTQKIDIFQRLATSGRYNFAVIRRKFITKWSLYRISIFYFYRWNQFNVILLACTLRTRNLSQSFFASSDATSQHALSHADSLSGRGLMTSLAQGKDRSFNKITRNCVMNCTTLVC